VTGHEQEDPARQIAGASDLDWDVLARESCLAFYMGVKSLPQICKRLIEHGMSGDTPAAAIRWGATPMQRTVVGTVATLPTLAARARLAPPAIIIVGKVVALRDAINWFEKRPLFGQTVAVTRTRQQASELGDRLGELGAHVIEAPTIELHEPDDWSAVDQALRQAAGFDWVIFTSPRAIEMTAGRLMHIGLDARALGQAKIAAIGPATALAIEQRLCLRVDLCPQSFVAEALASALETAGQIAGRKFLLLRADIARPLLTERLHKGQAAEVRDVPLYHTRAPAQLPPELTDALAKKEVDWVTFTSSSTARNFVALLGPDAAAQLRGVKIASIGPVTTATLKELRLKPTVQGQAFDIDGLLQALVAYQAAKK
jgi:uroporphyrinogen III methyltransferase/synthase